MFSEPTNEQAERKSSSRERVSSEGGARLRMETRPNASTCNLQNKLPLRCRKEARLDEDFEVPRAYLSLRRTRKENESRTRTNRPPRALSHDNAGAFHSNSNSISLAFNPQESFSEYGEVATDALEHSRSVRAPGEASSIRPATGPQADQEFQSLMSLATIPEEMPGKAGKNQPHHPHLPPPSRSLARSLASALKRGKVCHKLPNQREFPRLKSTLNFPPALPPPLASFDGFRLCVRAAFGSESSFFPRAQYFPTTTDFNCSKRT